jgi:hypothetical protein
MRMREDGLKRTILEQVPENERRGVKENHRDSRTMRMREEGTKRTIVEQAPEN